MFIAQVDVKTRLASRQWARPRKQLRRSLIPATQAASATSKIEELAAAKMDYYKRRTQREEERHVLDMEVLRLQQAYFEFQLKKAAEL